VREYAVRNGRIGYFAAYGNHLASLARQRAKAGAVRPLGYLWGFGLMRSHWTSLRQWLEPYYGFLSGRDYVQRPKREIKAHYCGAGHPLAWTSQDHLKKIGTYALGRVAINTFACFGRNIGEVGLTMNHATYAAGGFGKAELYPDPVTLRLPSSDEMEAMHAAEVAKHWGRLQRQPNLPR
jgi:hypothetical protein